MASTINLYNSLSGSKQPNGTWTFSGTQTSYPSAPGAYNGVIDFATYPAGTYLYTYTVTSGAVSSSSVLSIEWSGDGSDRINNVCGANITLGNTLTLPFQTTFNDDSRGVCFTGIAEPSDSGETIMWTNPSNYTKDLWYSFLTPSCSETTTYTITVDGSIFPNGLYGPAIQIYQNDYCKTCNTKESVSYSQTNANNQTVTISFSVAANTHKKIFIRLSSIVVGQFQLTIQSDSTCTPVAIPTCIPESTTIGNVWGYDGANVFGFAPDTTWGY